MLRIRMNRLPGASREEQSGVPNVRLEERRLATRVVLYGIRLARLAFALVTLALVTGAVLLFRPDVGDEASGDAARARRSGLESSREESTGTFPQRLGGVSQPEVPRGTASISAFRVTQICGAELMAASSRAQTRTLDVHSAAALSVVETCLDGLEERDLMLRLALELSGYPDIERDSAIRIVAILARRWILDSSSSNTEKEEIFGIVAGAYEGVRHPLLYSVIDGLVGVAYADLLADGDLGQLSSLARLLAQANEARSAPLLGPLLQVGRMAERRLTREAAASETLVDLNERLRTASAGALETGIGLLENPRDALDLQLGILVISDAIYATALDSGRVGLRVLEALDELDYRYAEDLRGKPGLSALVRELESRREEADDRSEEAFELLGWRVRRRFGLTEEFERVVSEGEDYYSLVVP